MSPNAKADLIRLTQLFQSNISFTFIRFSDGESEILHNRKLVISDGKTEFRGQNFSNTFPKYDEKTFTPNKHQHIRKDLLRSAIHSENNYFKGISVSSNNAVFEREFMLRLNGGFDNRITFSDLFVNSNFLEARNYFFPQLVQKFEQVAIVANWRAKNSSYFHNATHVPVPDNFFNSYSNTKNDILEKLLELQEDSLILSSASSMSNVIGYELRKLRPDITFIDVGTAINDLIGLDSSTRTYHRLLEEKTLGQKIVNLKYKLSRDYNIRW